MKANEEALRRAFASYCACKDECSKSGDWRPYVDMFIQDGAFVDHHGMGRFEGRNEIETYITGSMAPWGGRLSFPIDWVAVDVENQAVVFQVQNVFPEPVRPDTGERFGFSNWSRLVYSAPAKKWVSEETVYNPSRDAQKCVQGWRMAGGKFQSPEVVKYKFSNRLESNL